MFIKLIIIFSAAYIFNDLLLTVYCRFAEKIDRRKEIKRQKVYQTSNIGEATIENEKFTKYKLKSILGKTYTKWNPYIYGWMRYCIILVGRIPSTRIRNWKYRTIFNMKITKKTVIYGGCEIRSPWNIKADNCVISTYCILDGRRGITIGNNVVFGSGVHIWTEEHDVNDPYFAVNFNNAQPVVIEDHAWICSDSTILPGIHIGEGAVIATRAVVTKNCEEFSIYGGVPARKIGTRNNKLEYQLNGKPTWHYY